MSTLTITETDQVLYEMFTENTGTHMLDSGGAYGRAWERNQGKTVEDMLNAPEAWFSAGGEYVTIDAFRFLRDRLEYAEDLTHEYNAEYGTSTDPYLVDMEDFVERVDESGSFLEGRGVFNTYNYDTDMLSQILQGALFQIDGEQYVLLQVHGGCDVRGGYTAPKIFRILSDEPFELFDQGITIGCPESYEHSVDIRGYEATDYEGMDVDMPEDLRKCRVCNADTEPYVNEIY